MPEVPTGPPKPEPEVEPDAELGPDWAPKKIKAGYESRLCAEVVQYMGRGYSLTAFAGAVGVSRETLKDWMREHPDFAAAGEQGRAARARFLEAQFLAGGTGLKVAAHVFALKNAAPEDWREHPEAASHDSGPHVAFTMPENGRG